MRSVLLTLAAAVAIPLALGLAESRLVAEDAKIPMPADWDKTAANPEALAKYRCPKPSEFALVFSLGYDIEDMLPKDDAKFEQLVGEIKQAGFNTIHCTYTPKRLEACKKHGVKMMVHLLCIAEKQHVYKTVPEAKAMAEKLRGEPGIWGYNIWNDIMSRGPMIAGRMRDINNVRTWDPTHPAYCGGYRDYQIKKITNADVLGYYDFHWRRGIGAHLGGYPMTFLGLAKQNNGCYYTWLGTGSGTAGEDNYRKNLWSTNIGIACGLKGVLWFLAPMNPKTFEWTAEKEDIAKVNRSVVPMAAELAKIGNPVDVYSTPRTKDMAGAALPADQAGKVPGPFKPLGGDFWIQAAGGEFLLGMFADAQGEAAFLANHNAKAPQEVVLKFSKPVKVNLFDRAEGKYKPLAVQDNSVRLSIEAGGGQLLRFEK